MKKAIQSLAAIVLIAEMAFSSLAIAQSYPSPTYNNLSVNGTATIPHAAITGGTISGTPISGSTGAFTTLNSSGLATLNGLTVTNAPTFSTPVPVASGGTNSSTATGATNNLQYLPSFTGAIARAISTKFADRISVCDVGGCAGGDVSTAFQNAVAALPSGGGIIDVPDGAYTVNTAPTWGTKSVTWNFSPNAVITGTQTTFPRMFTNAGIPAVGPFIQSQSATVSPAGDATCVMCVESLPPSSLNGGVIASYAGTNLTGSGANSIATAQNLVATAQNGSSGNIWGQEIDVGMFAPTGTGTQFGLSLNGLGTGNPTFGIKIDRSDTSKWQQGIDIRNAQIGVNIENTTGLNNALVAGTVSSIFGGNTVQIGQLSNGNSALLLQRFTNTSPSGYLINAINANNTGQIFSVDVGGNTFAGGSLAHGAQEVDTNFNFSGPSSGGTVTMATGTETAILNPGGTLATLTITLPACNTAYNGSIARFSSTQAITSLTINATSGTVATGITSLAAGVGHAFLCRGVNTTWYPLY